MPYPTYHSPSVTGITYAPAGGIQQPLPPDSLCSYDDALLIQKAFGGFLTNAASTAALGFTFSGLDPASPSQPWYLEGFPAGSGFVGVKVAAMYAANTVNGGGVGNPGVWENLNTTPVWVPTAPVVVAEAAPLPPGTNIFGSLGAPGTITGVSLTAAQAASLAHCEALLVALAGVFHLSV